MKKILLTVAALLALSGPASAKWWIFGKTGGEIGLKYLYINGISADEAGGKIKIYRESLGPSGELKITGRASVGKSAVGSVRLSLDDKATWTDVKFSENGAFEYSFKPEAGRTYALLVEVTDTAGKTNKVAETRRELELTGENIQARVREALDALFDAYSREDRARFMAGVGENFAGDRDILERAVKRDFDALSGIVLRYTINNVAAGAQGRVFVSVTYNRFVTVNKTGATSTDTGFTEFVFDSNEGKLSLYSMKQPLMFGLSDAENVATGSVQGNNGTTLVLDDGGNLGGGGTLVTISCPAGSFPGYTFTTGMTACGAGSADLWFYDVQSMPTNLVGYSAPEKTIAETLASLTSAEVKDPSGYASSGSAADQGAGYSYCFQIGAGHYCFEAVSARPTNTNETITIRVKKF